MRALVLTFCLAAAPVGAENDQSHSPYAGQEARTLKNLSASDIDELKRGGGWGLAKVAELNGVPGPAHLLELQDAIPLRPDQVEAIEQIYAGMKSEAIAKGEALIAAETRLDLAFQNEPVSDAELRAMLAAVADARRELQYVHLSRHLSTPALLDPQQIARYNVLRGYTTDPCANVPEGHNASMWKKHNGCD